MNDCAFVLSGGMPRKSTMTDELLLDHALAVLREVGPDALTFGAVAKMTGLVGDNRCGRPVGNEAGPSGNALVPVTGPTVRTSEWVHRLIGCQLDLYAGICVRAYEAAEVWYLQLFGTEPSFLASETEAVWEPADHRVDLHRAERRARRPPRPHDLRR